MTGRYQSALETNEKAAAAFIDVNNAIDEATRDGEEFPATLAVALATGLATLAQTRAVLEGNDMLRVANFMTMAQYLNQRDPGSVAAWDCYLQARTGMGLQ